MAQAPGEERAEVAGSVSDVHTSMAGAVATVSLNRGPHNLLTAPALRGVADALHALSGNARCAVLCAEGRSFCAGADFRDDEAPDPTDAAGFEARTGAFYEQAARVFASPVPVVAAVHGPAIGAGFGLALACDLRVMGESAWFLANFVRLGIHPGFALTMTLPRLVGPGRACDLFLTGRRLHPQEALGIGVVDRVVHAGEELAAAQALASEIAEAAPLAVCATRSSLRAGLVEEARATMRHELGEQTVLAGTNDAIEGVQAMLEGRAPRFTGD